MTRKVKEGSRGREGGDGSEEREKEARRGYILTLATNKFDMILTYLFIKKYALALYFGLCSLDNKHKMKCVQFDFKKF